MMTATARRMTPARLNSLRLAQQRQFSATPPVDLLRLFGPSLFTVQQQAEAPDLPRTRLVKDVLRVSPPGGWQTDNGPWRVDQRLLETIAANTRRYIAARNPLAITKTHGDLRGMETHPDDIFTRIGDARVLGDTLYVTTYANVEQAAYLRNPARTVSVREVESFTDGAGNDYGPVLLHVALVDIPVITDQHPFIDLSRKNLAMPTISIIKKPDTLLLAIRRIAFATMGEELPADVSGDDLAAIVTGLALRCETKFGVKLPDPAAPTTPPDIPQTMDDGPTSDLRRQQAKARGRDLAANQREARETAERNARLQAKGLKPVALHPL